MSKKQTPSDFLKQIIGRPVVVKLNNGVDYRGKQQLSACEWTACLWTFVRNSNVLYEMVLLQTQKVGEREFVLWNLVPARTSFLLYPVKWCKVYPPSLIMLSLTNLALIHMILGLEWVITFNIRIPPPLPSGWGPIFSSYPWRLNKIAFNSRKLPKNSGPYSYPWRISWKWNLYRQRIPYFLTLPLKKSSVFTTYPWRIP